MNYIYPKFSKKDLMFFRFGGPGLGNLLFIYSRALILSNKYNMKLIWPTWSSIKIGPWIRHEKDKRFYANLFQNNSSYVSGLKRMKYLLTKSKMLLRNESQLFNVKVDETIFLYNNFQMEFKDLIDYHDLISADIERNLNSKYREVLNFDCSNAINIHVRLGDFSVANKNKLQMGYNNTRTPIDWYGSVIFRIQELLENKIIFNIFSDGTDKELEPLLRINGVRRMSFGSSIADIIALSKSNIIIASGSSFSMWARFLGRTSCIAYVNQLKDVGLANPQNGFEVELDENIKLTNEVVSLISLYYKNVLVKK